MTRMILLFVAALLLHPLVGFGQSKQAPESRQPRAAADFQTLFKKADAAREAEQTEDAIRLYKSALKAKPDSAEGWWYLGLLYYESDQYPEGRDAFRRLTSLKRDMALAWAMLGLCEFE